MNWYDKILDTVKLLISTRVILGLFIASCILLFVSPYLAIIKIDKVLPKYGEIIGLISISTFCILIADLIIFTTDKITKYLKSEIWKMRKIKKAIHSLTSIQKGILREFFLQGKERIKLPVNNPDVSSLIENQILDSRGVVQAVLPVGVIKYVEIGYYANRLLDFRSIGWPENSPTKHELIAITESRPKFIHIIEAGSPIKEWLNP